MIDLMLFVWSWSLALLSSINDIQLIWLNNYSISLGSFLLSIMVIYIVVTFIVRLVRD